MLWSGDHHRHNRIMSCTYLFVIRQKLQLLSYGGKGLDGRIAPGTWSECVDI